MSIATRPRDIARKQFQEAAAATIDLQAEAIATLAKDIQSTREFLADQATRIDALGKRVDDSYAFVKLVESCVKLDYAAAVALEKRGFWGRLRWLFTGK